MLLEKLQELRLVENQCEKLTKQIKTHMSAELAALPQAYGFDSLKKFIAAVRAASRMGARRKPERKRRRTKITPDLAVKIRAMSESGKSNYSICAELRISPGAVDRALKKRNRQD